MPAISRHDLESDGIELLFVEIVGNTGTLLVGLYYRSPADDDSLPKLHKVLRDLLPKLRSSLLIMGDFNCPGIDWSSSPQRTKNGCPSSSALLEILSEFRLCQKVKESTMLTRDGKEGNLLDLNAPTNLRSFGA